MLCRPCHGAPYLHRFYAGVLQHIDGLGTFTLPTILRDRGYFLPTSDLILPPHNEAFTGRFIIFAKGDQFYGSSEMILQKDLDQFAVSEDEQRLLMDRVGSGSEVFYEFVRRSLQSRLAPDGEIIFKD